VKASILKRIDQLEFRNLPKLCKPCLFLREQDPEPENPEDYYKIIRTRIVDHSNYLEPTSSRLPYCPV